MKCNFLLDENIVVRGLVGRSKAARDIWPTIRHNCHRIVISTVLAERYWQKLRQIRRRAAPEASTALAAIMNEILVNEDKAMWVEPQSSRGLSYLVRHPNDRFLADIAAEFVGMYGASNCILVTTDGDTRTDFNCSQMKSLGIRGVTIEEGLTLAKQQDC